jgi:cytochrome P450
LSFLLALSSRPHVLRKCQAEVDQAVGMERSPGAADMPKLPYLRAAMKEVRIYPSRSWSSTYLSD